MQTLFENKVTQNRDMAKEVYRYHCFRRPFIVFLNILIFIDFVFTLYCTITDKFRADIVLVLVPVYFLLEILMYFRLVNLMVKRSAEIHGGPISAEMNVTDEYIEQTASTGGVAKLEYSNVKKVIQTKNYILLLSKARYYYIFSKTGFTSGTPDEFVAFLKNKGFKVR